MDTQETTEPIRKKKSAVRLVILVVLAIAIIFFAWKKISFALNHETTDDAQISTQITPILPRVSGYLKEIYVNDYDSVKAGQLVAVIDDADLVTELKEMEASLQASEADLLNAKAGLNNAQVSIVPSKGNIDLTDVKIKQAEEDYQRNLNLYNEQAITKKQLDDSRYALEALQQQKNNNAGDLQTVRSRVNIQTANIAKAEAAIKAQQARIDQQKLKISYTKIYSPITGKLGKNNVTVGQMIQAGTPIFSVVNDSTFWVVANFKETQIKTFRPGMTADIELDAYPGQKLEGTISSISLATGAQFALLPPDNASGNFVKVTQRVPVKIDIKDVKAHKDILRNGLSAYIIVPTK
ncbi:MAG: HlyD family secretion protein [Chitinophagaceae bacterium]